jgi:hypothetical protein
MGVSTKGAFIMVTVIFSSVLILYMSAVVAGNWGDIGSD